MWAVLKGEKTTNLKVNLKNSPKRANLVYLEEVTEHAQQSSAGSEGKPKQSIEVQDGFSKARTERPHESWNKRGLTASFMTVSLFLPPTWRPSPPCSASPAPNGAPDTGEAIARCIDQTLEAWGIEEENR
ncbi:hypothetical protein AMECASPLE_031511 [Ameca splendens]|uniref:Uncharacterized protein n=1 Tax=Ameca splendens TaxID=208324 RepID=A0ABV1ACR0_9TELE